MVENKRITCIECPKSCRLEIEAESGKFMFIKGNECKKGETYAKNEIECPARILTSTILAEGLELRMVPVRTNKPIPKEKMFDAMERIKHIRIKTQGKTGDVIEKNFIGTGFDLILTRDIE
ncbi:MAG: DUF1667 domain-containing protein [Candidatus Saganbacteria bacterium]|nr:DUF1667 domain-containing protein [Candidatus Saganbacteria bacterium]